MDRSSFGRFLFRGQSTTDRAGAPAALITIPELTVEAIRTAHAGSIPPSRIRRSTSTRACRARLGVPVIVKVETVNPIRSFKGRGTWIAVQALAGEGRIGPDRADRRRVSAGNFGQGVAYAARVARRPGGRLRVAQREPRQGRPGCGRSAPRSRRSGRTSTRPGPPRRRTRREHGAELLVDGDDPRISTGAATHGGRGDRCGRGRPPAQPGDRSSVPVGNGALINGVGVVAAGRAAGRAGSSGCRPRAPRR